MAITQQQKGFMVINRQWLMCNHPPVEAGSNFHAEFGAFWTTPVEGIMYAPSKTRDVVFVWAPIWNTSTRQNSIMQVLMFSMRVVDFKRYLAAENQLPPDGKVELVFEPGRRNEHIYAAMASLAAS